MAAYVPTLKTQYKEQIVPALMKEFGYTSIMQCPKLEKIVINQGMGQAAASRVLDRRGYEIVERNWTCAAGEADIIARDGDSVVFVEVKTRSSCDYGMPAEAVDEAKRDRYERIAALFLQGFHVVDVPVRFAIVSIVAISPDRAMIRHHINAFSRR